MIITTNDGKSFNTDIDLTSSERHVLQKLILWEPVVSSITDFREIITRALKTGWNNSGPVHESTALKKIICFLEEKVSSRLSSESSKS